MTPPDASRRALDVSADLRIDIDGVPDAVRVTGDGPRVTVAVSDAATAARIVRDGRRLGGVRDTLAVLTGGLSEIGVGVDVTVGGTRVASLGPGSAGGPVARAVARAAGLEGVTVAAPPRRVQLALGALAAGLALGVWWAARRR